MLVGRQGIPDARPDLHGRRRAAVVRPVDDRARSGKAAALQAVLAKVVSVPATEAGSRGVTAAVVSDKWSWSGAAGTALTPETSMGVASITNTSVAAEVMLLARAGKVARTTTAIPAMSCSAC
jgi:CubicO group peptidase (beta-lactamase class C family)